MYTDGPPENDKQDPPEEASRDTPSITIAPSAISQTLACQALVAAQPVTSRDMQKIGPVDRKFVDILDAECIFIELLDECDQDKDGVEETDVTDDR